MKLKQGGQNFEFDPGKRYMILFGVNRSVPKEEAEAMKDWYKQGFDNWGIEARYMGVMSSDVFGVRIIQVLSSPTQRTPPEENGPSRTDDGQSSG